MPLSRDHHDLFRLPGTADKLDLLQSLSDAKDLTSDQALALLNIIRAELEQPQKQTPSTYRRYAEVTTSLCQQLPEVYWQMVNAWQQRRQVRTAESVQGLKEPEEEHGKEVAESEKVEVQVESQAESDHLAVEAAAGSEHGEVEMQETGASKTEEEPPPAGAE